MVSAREKSSRASSSSLDGRKANGSSSATEPSTGAADEKESNFSGETNNNTAIPSGELNLQEGDELIAQGGEEAVRSEIVEGNGAGDGETAFEPPSRPNDTQSTTSQTRMMSPSPGNELSELIPGYVAPLKLDTSALDKYRPAGGIAELRRRAERSDASTAQFVVEAAEPRASAMKRTSNGFLPSTYTYYSSFKTGIKRPKDVSAGTGWFGMMPSAMTDELKTDLAVIRNRNYLDPKRFYKSADKMEGKVLQVGTVIEGSAEFYSARLTKKQRRQNLTEEIMADPAAADYTKNKYRTMQQTNTAKYQKFRKKRVSRKARRGYK